MTGDNFIYDVRYTAPRHSGEVYAEHTRLALCTRYENAVTLLHEAAEHFRFAHQRYDPGFYTTDQRTRLWLQTREVYDEPGWFSIHKIRIDTAFDIIGFVDVDPDGIYDNSHPYVFTVVQS